MKPTLTDNDEVLRHAVQLAKDQFAAGEPISPARVSVADGLYLLLQVKAKPAARWRLDYAIKGVRKTLSVGIYPVVSYARAVAEAETMRARLKLGVDPSDDRKAQRAKEEATAVAARQAAELAEAARQGRVAAGTFEAVVREFADVKGAGEWSPLYKLRWLRTFEIDSFPRIGAVPIGAVTRQMIVAAAKAVEARGAHETAHLLAQWTAAALRYAVNAGYIESTPAEGISSVLVKPESRNMGAAVTPEDLRLVLIGIREYRGHPITRAALRFSALVYQRPGNVRAAEWSEIDLDGAMWEIPAQKMKRRLEGKRKGPPHHVPLSRQAVELLRELEPLTRHTGPYVFPSLQSRGRCMSEGTVLVALRRMGFSKTEMSAHGFRAAARTIGAEVLKIDAEVLEAQLAHAKTGPLGTAYDRTKWLPERRQAMQVWADYVDLLASDENRVVKLRA